MKELQIDRMNSPIGTILIVVDDEQLCSLDYAGYEQRMMILLEKRYGQVSFRQTADPCGFSGKLHQYFAGDYHCLDTIAVNTGGTAFQQQVWSLLRTILPGTTMTYG